MAGTWLAHESAAHLAGAPAAPSAFSGGANVVAVLVLLLEFGMFRQALLRDQIRLYAAQSAAVSVLAVIVAAARHVPELYVLAALSAALKVVIVPLVMRRVLRGAGAEIAGSGTLGVASLGRGGGAGASTLLLAIAVGAF